MRQLVTSGCVAVLAACLPLLVGSAQGEGLDDALDALGIPVPAEEQQEADIYSVVSGDTLWGICERFFGDPDYWPALWSINNDEITNPHYIYPDQMLQFQPGSDTLMAHHALPLLRVAPLLCESAREVLESHV